MISNLRYVLNTILNKAKLRNHLQIKGFQAFSNRTKLKAEEGGMISINKISTQENVHLVSVGGKLQIGKGVYFNRNCIVICRNEVIIEDDCIFGPNVVIYDHDHDFSSEGIDKTSYKYGSVRIRKGCWIGSGVTILRGSDIGEGSVIGAGVIIKGEIPSHSIVTVHQDLHMRRISD